MRQIDQMTPEEIDALKVKGMLNDQAYGKRTPWHDPQPLPDYRACAERLAEACMDALDYAEDVCPSASLPYEAKMKLALAEWEKSR